MINRWCVTHNNKTLKIGRSKVYNCKFGFHNIVYDNTVLVNVTVGDYSYIGGDSKIHNATIGKFCSLGPDLRIGLGRHPLKLRSTFPGFYSNKSDYYGLKKEYDNNEPEYLPVIIENDVWIGTRATILDGVSIGNGAVVGAGSLVTKNVPPYAIVGGVPAKIIGYRFSELEIKDLLENQWWNDPKYKGK